MDKIKLILGSKSPRRQNLIKTLGFDVEVWISEIDEIYPEDLDPRSVPEYLARLKSEPLIDSLNQNELLITSDTVVLLNGDILGKPKDRVDSIVMLNKISGNTHEVITGVSIVGASHAYAFSTVTKVTFSELETSEIEYYVDEYEPFDKAGSYGIQEWIGYIGVKKIEGCYYNVMGLPIHDLYRALKKEFSI